MLKGRGGTDGARGVPGESGAKVFPLFCQKDAKMLCVDSRLSIQ